VRMARSPSVSCAMPGSERRRWMRQRRALLPRAAYSAAAWQRRGVHATVARVAGVTAALAAAHARAQGRTRRHVLRASAEARLRPSRG
jgi:hypothetical protein